MVFGKKQTITKTTLPPVKLPAPDISGGRRKRKGGTPIPGAVTTGGGVITIDGRDYVVNPTQRKIIEKARGIEKTTPTQITHEPMEDFDLEQAKADIRGEAVGEQEVPEGRQGTDIQQEKKLREQGLITVQTGTDESGFPLTSVVSFEEFQRLGLVAEKTEAELTGEVLGIGAIATPGGVVGGLPTGITKPALKVGKGKTSTNLLKGDLKKSGIKLIEKDRQIRKIGRDFSVSRDTAQQLYSKYQGTAVEKIGEFMTNPATWKWAGAGLLGTSLMSAWLGSDNVLSSSAFTMIKLRDAVESGQMTKEEALEESDEIQIWMDTARTVVNIMTRINPFLWSSRGTYMANADKAQTDFDLELRRILLFEPEVN